MKMLLIAVAVALFGAKLVYFGISAYMARSLTRVERIPLEESPADLGLKYENVSFPSRVDQLTIRGWYLPGGGDERCIILVHGVEKHRADPSIDTLGLARDLVGQGLGVLMFDMRGHGESEGDRLSVGYYERRDLLGAIDYLRGRGIPAQRIGILGFSLGGAIALLVAAEEPEILAVVSDSSFANLSELLEHQASQRSGLPPIFNPGMVFMVRVLYGFDLTAIRPVEAVAKISQSVLFIHGEKDDVVPLGHAQRLLAASPDPQSELWIVPGAEHVKSYKTSPEEYVARVVSFFKGALK